MYRAGPGKRGGGSGESQFKLLVSQVKDSLKKMKADDSDDDDDVEEWTGDVAVMNISMMFTAAMNDVANAKALVDAGIVEVCIDVLKKALDPKTGKDWRGIGQRNYLTYYCTHILGSVCMKKKYGGVDRLEKNGGIPLLVQLGNGAVTWVERRAAMRALSNLTGYNPHATQDKIQRSISLIKQMVDAGVIPSVMELMVDSQLIVYKKAYLWGDDIGNYHHDLLTYYCDVRGEMKLKLINWADTMQIYALTCLCGLSRDVNTRPKLYEAGIMSKYLRAYQFSTASQSINELSDSLHHMCMYPPARTQLESNGLFHVIKRMMTSHPNVGQVSLIFTCCDLAKDRLYQHHILQHGIFPILLSYLHYGMKGEDADWIYTIRKNAKEAVEALIAVPDLPGIEECKKQYEEYNKKVEVDKTRTTDQLKELQKEAIALKNQGNDEFGKEKYLAAIDLYKKALTVCPFRDPTTASILYCNMAECAIRLNQFEDAYLYAVYSISLNCAQDKAYWRKSIALGKLGETTMARIHIEGYKESSSISDSKTRDIIASYYVPWPKVIASEVPHDIPEPNWMEEY